MGIFTSGASQVGLNDNYLNTLPVDSFSSQLLRLQPNGSAPLFMLLDSFKSSSTALQPAHSFFTEKLVFPSMKLNGAIGDGVTTAFTVDSTALVIPNGLYKVATTGEVVFVTAVGSATGVTVVRGFGTTAAGAIADDVELYHVGNAHEIASDKPESMAMMQVETTNYTQIFRNAWAIPGTVAETKLKAIMDKTSKDRTDCGWFHAIDIEKSLFFGEQKITTKNGRTLRTMNGLINQIALNAPGNITAAGGTTTFDQLETMLDPAFDTVTDPSFAQDRVLVCGGTARKVINGIGVKTGQYQLVDAQTNFGLRFETFKMTRGTFALVEHPLFNTNALWSKYAVAVDMSSLGLAWLGGRRTFHRGYNQGVNTEGGPIVDNGIDAEGGVITSELTLEVFNPSANIVITNLTAAA